MEDEKGPSRQNSTEVPIEDIGICLRLWGAREDDQVTHRTGRGRDGRNDRRRRRRGAREESFLILLAPIIA